MWGLLILLIFCLAPLVVTTERYEQVMNLEVEQAYRWYGEDVTNRILDTTNKLYGLGMMETGVDKFIRKHGMKKTTDEIISQKLQQVEGVDGYKPNIDNYWGNILRNVWLFCFRIAHSWAWFLWVGPFFFAAVYDGIMSRKTKQATFKYTSPTVYNFSWHAIIFVVSTMLLLYAITIPLNNLLFPSMLVCIGFNVRLLISNIQHSA
jgi:hypothetical protein